MNTYKLNISIDDVNPKKGWRILGEPTEDYLRKLYDTFGAKTTLFIPSNHHGDSPISEHQGWIDELRSLPYIELAAHGHYHNTTNSLAWGECEFAEINSIESAKTRIQLLLQEWMGVNYIPHVWKSPGWLASRQSVQVLDQYFKYAVIHPQHNQNLMWKCKVINSTDYFPPNSFPGTSTNLFILSHIHGKHDNTWNENFYSYTNTLLTQLHEHITLKHVFIKEFED